MYLPDSVITIVDSGATKNTQISDPGLLLHIRGKVQPLHIPEQGETKELCKDKR